MRQSRISLSNAFVAILAFPLTTTTTDAFQSLSQTLRLNVPQHQLIGSTRSSFSELGAVADLPMEKEDEKQSGRKNNAWIERDGGFIPNLKGRLTKTPPPLQVTDMYQYKDEVVDVDDRIVCVRFYAPWCKACKAIEGKFRRLAKDYPEVKFVEVPVTKDNAMLHQALDIPSLPFAHIYEPTVGLVEERKINKNVFKEFKMTLNQYVEGECELMEDDDDDERVI